MIHVSAAIICNELNEIIICQRGPVGSCALLWEFPGGKQEPNETSDQCLVRECREELSIDIEIIDLFAETTYTYPECEIVFSFFNAHIIHGTPKCIVHNEIKWVNLKSIGKYGFCPADIEIVHKLKLQSQTGPKINY